MNPCNLCPRKCNIDRSQSLGFCGESEALSVARIAPHFFEEPPISYKKGSGTVFFTGCNLRCEFCQNKAISRGNAEGKIYTKNELIDALCSLQESGVHNINLVTPTHFADKIADILSDMRSRGLLKVPPVGFLKGFSSWVFCLVKKGTVWLGNGLWVAPRGGNADTGPRNAAEGP